MGQRYYVDPSRIEAATKQLEDIGTLAGEMADEFLNGLAPTINWPGFKGEFAEKARPQEQQERQTTRDTVTSVRDAIQEVTKATVSQVRMMKNTRDRNIEDVERVNNRINTPEIGGDHGSGGHGRR
ncbi:hypothetical protein [Streptomyces sp. NPDC086787]|uniref:hypothetical protein n=1 Tax=Streptomyces sp. NPDC086787 TaxID=3365759 RepID=UPI0037F75406